MLTKQNVIAQFVVFALIEIEFYHVVIVNSKEIKMYDDLSRFFEKEQQIKTRISFFFFLSESFRKKEISRQTNKESRVLVTAFLLWEKTKMTAENRTST